MTNTLSITASMKQNCIVASKGDFPFSLWVTQITRLNFLDRVLRSAVSLTGRVDHNLNLPVCVMIVLHWLTLRQRIEFKIPVLVWHSLIGKAPAYLTDLCHPSLSAWSTRHLHVSSAEQGLFHVPFARISAMQSWTLSALALL